MFCMNKPIVLLLVIRWKATLNVCELCCQVAKRNSVPLGLSLDRPHQHPHVLSGVAMDARSLPTFLPSRPPTGQSGTARRGRPPLHDVSSIQAVTEKQKKNTDENYFKSAFILKLFFQHLNLSAPLKTT